MTKISEAAKNFRELSDALKDTAKKNQQLFQTDAPKKDFLDFVKDGMDTINTQQNEADKMSTELAIGKEDNIHETMLALAKTELSFNLMVQIRNKALEAYQEVMRMPV